MLLGLAAGLAALDQIGKTLVVARLPSGSRLVLIPGAFRIERSDNLAASWALNRLGLQAVGIGWLIGLSMSSW